MVTRSHHSFIFLSNPKNTFHHDNTSIKLHIPGMSSHICNHHSFVMDEDTDTEASDIV
jgi:hypothetical protein